MFRGYLIAQPDLATVDGSAETDRRCSFYRPEIDGLRAIAVISVMLFHAGFWPAGGFAGVDVFLVISGYLITSMLLREYRNGGVRILAFYVRRIRRIAPLLLTVLVSVACIASLLLLPEELADFGRSLAAASALSANIYFWRTSGGYFALASENKPLLHVWSLSVEEQFYLVYPLFVIACLSIPLLRERRGFAAALAGCCLLTFAATVVLVSRVPTSSFFLLPTRSWEFLAGGLVAVAEAKRKAITERGGIASDLACLAGLVLIIGAFILLNAETPFPGVFALPTVVGTMLVLLCARSAQGPGRILASRPLVALGILSYGAYLWHQPLLAFARAFSLGEPAPQALAALLIGSFGVAALTWRFVEQPFRRAGGAVSEKALLIGIAVLSAVLLMTGAALHLTGGAPGRYPRYIADLAGLREAYQDAMLGCFFLPGDPPRAFGSACVRGREGPVSYAFLGDSHVAALAPAFDTFLAKHHHRAVMLAAPGCAPMTHAELFGRYRAACAAYMRRALVFLEGRPDLATIVISARWANALHRTWFDNGEGGVERDFQDTPVTPIEQRRIAEDIVWSIRRLLADGRRVVLVYPVPEPGWDVPRYLVKSWLRGRKIEDGYGPLSQRVAQRSRMAEAILDSLGSPPGLARLYPARRLCAAGRDGRCRMTRKMTPFYFDDNHLTVTGAREALPLAELERVLQPAGIRFDRRNRREAQFLQAGHDNHSVPLTSGG